MLVYSVIAKRMLHPVVELERKHVSPLSRVAAADQTALLMYLQESVPSWVLVTLGIHTGGNLPNSRYCARYSTGGLILK